MLADSAKPVAGPGGVTSGVVFAGALAAADGSAISSFASCLLLRKRGAVAVAVGGRV